MTLIVRPLEAERFSAPLWGKWLALFLFSHASAFFVKKATGSDLRMWQLTLVAFILSALCGLLLKAGKGDKRFHFLLTSIPIALLAVHLWFVQVFGLFDVGAFLFHLQMGVGGFGLTVPQVHSALRYAGYCLLLIASLHYLSFGNRRIVVLDRFLVVPLLLASPIILSSISNAYHLLRNDGDKLIAYYQEAAIIAPPGKMARKNLIIIYAESTERTFRALKNGRDVFADMDAVSARGVSFDGVRQATNTGWSMAGVVATQCGVPLQPLGLFEHNNFEGVEHFLPGAVCLGDILSAQGYRTGFITTGALQFAGANLYLRQHGYDDMWGRDSFDGEKLSYPNVWGVDDDTMLNFAFDRITELSGDKQSYALSLQTIGGHSPEGFPTESCRSAIASTDEPQILYAIRCMGFEIRRFVDRLDHSGILENTVVVIVSDHLSMKTAVWDDLNRHDRMNYVTVIGVNGAAGELRKSGTMVDVYPTLLEALGFSLNDHQAGLGISLLSEKPTLADDLGLEVFNGLIAMDSALSQKLWSPDTNLR